VSDVRNEVKLREELVVEVALVRVRVRVMVRVRVTCVPECT